MIKRTLYFGNPAYLSLTNSQLVLRLPEVEKSEVLSEYFKKEATRTVPVEDIGVVVLDNKRITITQGLLAALLENNAALITCNEKHMPAGLMLNLDGHTTQQERFSAQIEASLPLKKQLWAQTVSVKIRNQASLLAAQKIAVENMHHWADCVKSGDGENHEARAAAYYWGNLFSEVLVAGPPFRRDQEGAPPNNFLNYGYAILRAITARSLVGSGLLPTLGIFHSNKYNAYCLADDIMEPYRPFVDELVLSMVKEGQHQKELGREGKAQLMGIASADVLMEGEKSPLMVAMGRTTASLAKCFEGGQRKIIYPEFA